VGPLAGHRGLHGLAAGGDLTADGASGPGPPRAQIGLKHVSPALFEVSYVGLRWEKTMTDDIRAIFDRIVAGRQSRADIDELRDLLVRGDRNVVQLGSHNISLQGAREIHIDNRSYYGAEADAIRAALVDIVPGRGALRSVGGFIITIGIVIALVGMGMFFYSLLSVLGSPPGRFAGPPPGIITGFGIAVAGVFVGILGTLVVGWSKARTR
jgi:hypothetical protein